MAELTQEYFDKQYKELVEFLGDQFTKSNNQIVNVKGDLTKVAMAEDMSDGFAQQDIKLNFIQMETAAFRKDLAALSKRTKEDDGAFIKDLLKLKNRMDQFEKQLKKLKMVRA